MRKTVSAIVLGFLGFLSGNEARAGVSFDQTLVSPTATPTNPGFYNGAGNPSNNFTVDNSNGIEVGLRARFRYGSNVTPIGNVYDLPAGSGANPAQAVWNFDFSIDLCPKCTTITPALTLSGVTTKLTITDTTTGVSNGSSLDVLNPLLDNDGWGPSGKNKSASNATIDWGAQNSENLGFGFLIPFDPNANDVYIFKLDVFSKASGTPLLASVTMEVDVPEPASMGLMMTGLLGLGFLRRRRRL